MAAAAIATATDPWEMNGAFDSATIRGIGRPLAESDLILSSESYNGLLPIEDQIRLQASHGDHIKALLAIINSHGMGNFFGVHSLHRHGTVPEKTVRLGADVPGINNMKWTRAIPITKELLAQDNIHVTFFKVHGGNLVPLEFAIGPSPLIGQELPSQFIRDVAKYLFEHDLTGLIAIEVGDFTKARSRDAKPTSELEVVWGNIEELTVVLPSDQMVKGVTNPVPTGWNVQDFVPENDPDGPDPGEHWNEATKPEGIKTHKVHVDTVEPITSELLKAALVNLGYIKA